MYELSQIILWILWSLRPAMAVEANLVDIIRTGFALFADDETLAALAGDPDHCAGVHAALADAHTKLDLMIYLRACEIAGVRCQSRGFEPNRTTTRSRHTPDTCWRSFRRLVHRFDDRERLAHLRAERLQREQAQSPLRLDASDRSTSPMLLMVEDLSVMRDVLHRLRRGRWIARSCAQDGGGSLRTRGPPPSFPKTRTASPHAHARERTATPTHHATSGNLSQLPVPSVARDGKRAYDPAHDHPRQNPSTQAGHQTACAGASRLERQGRRRKRRRPSSRPALSAPNCQRLKGRAERRR